MTNSNGQEPDGTPGSDGEDLTSLVASRRRKMQQLVDLGVDPYGQRFDDRQWIRDIQQRVGEIVYRTVAGQDIALPPITEETKGEFRNWLAQQPPGEIAGPTVRAAGRIVLHRDKGKLQFIDIRDWTGDIQLFVGQNQVGPENWQWVQCLDLGDLIGVDGELRFTKTGELSVFAKQIHILTKTLDPPPDKHKGLTDLEMRQRRRYIDLAYNQGVIDRFRKRSRIVDSIRSTLIGDGFLEIEGPTLHTIAGGAAARPFETHHNTLDMPLVLRIALELHLKRLLVGGMERVFELGRVYRNEGISPRHNPEFTMLEVYQAYGDYRSMMDLTEKLICGAIQAISLPYQLPWGVDQQIDFTPPFQRATYHELLQQVTGIDPWDHGAVAKYAQERGLTTADKHPDVIKSELFEAYVEDALVGPVFVTDYPASICPLTKRNRLNPELAERFELFVHGMELANAYTELNDPDLQETLFRTQLAGMSQEDSMARMDHDFIRALRNGMPPAGGLGIGIDRLVMLLTNSASIRDIILFPLLRPES
jgi:lysyl-tRNA synthetase class 2